MILHVITVRVISVWSSLSRCCISASRRFLSAANTRYPKLILCNRVILIILSIPHQNFIDLIILLLLYISGLL